MVDYANKKYGSITTNFKVLDIEKGNDCANCSDSYDKIFSFFCFHWIRNKDDALFNMHLMLKRGGEILVYFFLINPMVDLYKSMDEEWQHYIKVSIY